jgi:hypothetical protein
MGWVPSSTHSLQFPEPIATARDGSAMGKISALDMASRSQSSKRTLAQRMEALDALRSQPDSAESRQALADALSDRRNLLVAAAANIVAKAELTGFTPQLLAAFDRFMDQPERVDKGCHAKSAIAQALYRTEARAGDVFRKGVRYVQLEPVWGGKQDTAVELRVTCALGLVRSHEPDVMLDLATLLADSEVMARIGAAHAIAYSGQLDAGVPLLRFKVVAGDQDMRVTSACLTGLMALDPVRSLPMLGELLYTTDDGLFEAAAVALGESRLAAATEVLQRACDEALLGERRGTLMLALSMLRNESAWAYLLRAVAQSGPAQAEQALKALAIFAHDSTLRERVQRVIDERADPRLVERARELFASRER